MNNYTLNSVNVSDFLDISVSIFMKVNLLYGRADLVVPEC